MHTHPAANPLTAPTVPNFVYNSQHYYTHYYIPERQSFVSKIEDVESQVFKYGVG